jgi:hypothetical protein
MKYLDGGRYPLVTIGARQNRGAKGRYVFAMPQVEALR